MLKVKKRKIKLRPEPQEVALISKFHCQYCKKQSQICYNLKNRLTQGSEVELTDHEEIEALQSENEQIRNINSERAGNANGSNSSETKLMICPPFQQKLDIQQILNR